MKREIKFRIWDTETNTFVGISNHNSIFANEGILTKFFRNDRYVLQQYVGKTEHGKEIYEGDIINGKANRYVVEYDENRSQFVGRGIFYSKPTFDFEFIKNGILLGNIYENPDRLTL